MILITQDLPMLNTIKIDKEGLIGNLHTHLIMKGFCIAIRLYLDLPSLTEIDAESMAFSGIVSLHCESSNIDYIILRYSQIITCYKVI